MAHGFSNFEDNFDPHSEYVPPLKVYYDNNACPDCTILMVCGANRHGILLKIVQVLTDLDLIILRSKLSSDKDSFMNAFHVTNSSGHKVIDMTLLHYVQQSLNVAQRQRGTTGPSQVTMSRGRIVTAGHFASNCSGVQITSIDRPGILSEITSVLEQLSCIIDSGEMWTHNGRVACILYIKDRDTGHHIYGKARLLYLRQYLARVVKAHHSDNESWDVQLLGIRSCRIHTERQLHKLMQGYKDFDVEPLPSIVANDHSNLVAFVCGNTKGVCQPQVLVESWKEKCYLIINMRSVNRPKLMFDTMCILTDLDYDVCHGTISSHGSLAVQEYFVRRVDGCIEHNELEKQNLVRSLTAATERRIASGIKMEVRTLDRPGLLSKLTSVLRENSLSLKMAKFAKDDILAIGTFYITNASSAVDVDDIDRENLEAALKQIDNGVSIEKKTVRDISPLPRRRKSLFSTLYSLGKSLWSNMKQFFCKLSFIR